MELRRALLAVPLALALADGARAVDGVIEIDASRAAAGGITPGDTAGYPVTIAASGSYRLTGDLIVQDQTAIQITAGEVSLDLNGFAIRCASTCTSGNGIDAAVSGVMIRNGTVRGMGGYGVLAGSRARLVDLDASHNGEYGIHGGSACLGRNLRAEHNGEHGLTCSGILQDSVARENGWDGIRSIGGVAAHNESIASGAAPSGINGNGIYLVGGVAVGNLVEGAGLDGIRSQQPSVVLNNVVTNSALRGLFHEGFGSLGSGGDLFDDNGTNGAICVIGAACLELADDLCGGSTMCP
jgi:hypothetical protein